MKNINTIKKLKPSIVWQAFNELSKIPRDSCKEQNISNYIKEILLTVPGAKAKQDKIFNLVAYIPASKNCSKIPMLTLQSHLDMVCDKNKGKKHDFTKDPIELVVFGNKVSANGTTLGADNGIGLAYMIAVATDKSIKHGPLELVFTVDEELNSTGIDKMSKDFLQGKYLVNLDGESDNIIFYGSAGISDGALEFSYSSTQLKNNLYYEISVDGLKSGHSGGDIHLHIGNANKLIIDILYQLNNIVGINLCAINGGKQPNIITPSCKAIICFDSKKLSKVNSTFKLLALSYKQEYIIDDANIKFSLIKTQPQKSLSKSDSDTFINLMNGFKHGISAFNKEKSLIEGSSNLGVIKTNEKSISTIFSVRGLKLETINQIIRNIVSPFLTSKNFKYTLMNILAPWEPSDKNVFPEIMKKSFVATKAKNFNLFYCDGALETNQIMFKFPKFKHAVSIGPSIHKCHSTSEWVDIKSVEKIFNVLKHFLVNFKNYI